MESTLNDNGGDLSFSEDFRKRVTTNLENHPTVTHDGHDLRKAAVAIAITPLENGQSGFILTRRGKNLKTHSYQYALPGGKIDEGETQDEDEGGDADGHSDGGDPTYLTCVDFILFIFIHCPTRRFCYENI